MTGNIKLEDFRNTRNALHKRFRQFDPGLEELLDNPFLKDTSLDLAERLLEYRTTNRGVIIDVRTDMFDAFFNTVGLHDEWRLLVIGTPLPVEKYLEKIALACRAWILEGQNEKTTLSIMMKSGDCK